MRTVRTSASLPFFGRREMYGKRLFRDQFRLKRTVGTVSMTSVGMFGNIAGGSTWVVPVRFHPLTTGLGAIARKPASSSG